MCNPKIVTTSWDDGNVSDMRLAELLRSTGLTGTFYIPIRGYNGMKTLGHQDLRALRSEGLEIGAHSVSHGSLSKLNEEDLGHEVRDCKQILEQSLGEEVPMFCYPNGRYNASVIRQVQRAGYKGARTTQMLSLRADFQRFEIPTTVQAYPHASLAYMRNLGRAKHISGMVRYITRCRRAQTWVEVGKEMFQSVLEHGGIWHLYGHSWEIDQLKIWSDLKELLEHVSRHKDVTYATNGQLISQASTGSLSQNL